MSSPCAPNPRGAGCSLDFIKMGVGGWDLGGFLEGGEDFQMEAEQVSPESGLQPPDLMSRTQPSSHQRAGSPSPWGWFKTYEAVVDWQRLSRVVFLTSLSA